MYYFCTLVLLILPLTLSPFKYPLLRCQSGLASPMELKECMWQLACPDVLLGESGYYLTVFESALVYLQNMDANGNWVEGN